MYRQALNMFAAFAAMVAASVVFPSFGEDGKSLRGSDPIGVVRLVG